MKTSALTHAMRPIHSAQLRMLLSLAKLVSRGTGWDGRDGRDRMGRTVWEGQDGADGMGGTGWGRRDGRDRMGRTGWEGQDGADGMGGTGWGRRDGRVILGFTVARLKRFHLNGHGLGFHPDLMFMCHLVQHEKEFNGKL